MVFAHDRGWPAPDDKERSGPAIADAMMRRGIGVAVVAFSLGEKTPFPKACEEVASAVRDVIARAGELGLAREPVLAGDEVGASLVATLALDARYALGAGKIRGVIGMNGIYGGPPETGEEPDAAPLALARTRADAPPFLILSAHDESRRSPPSSRTFARALEAKGAKDVRVHHVGTRDVRSLSNLSGERNDVGELVAAFVRGDEKIPGGADGAWAVDTTWGRAAPLSSEPFRKDPSLVVRRPADVGLRAQLLRVFGETMHELEPWPVATYDAVDLLAWLGAHPELGAGDFVEVTNVRGEKLVLTRAELEKGKPLVVVGIDDETNLFRMLVTYNVYRSYSWKPETEPRPLLARPVGAFLYFPSDGERPARVATLADFALTTSSFKVLRDDPLASVRALPKAVTAVLTNEQGCLQCHSLRGAGARAHHLRAADGKPVGGDALPLEEYPREVLTRFLFHQEEVAKSFGVSPLMVPEATARELLAVVAK